jgi:hypothetical protein
VKDLLPKGHSSNFQPLRRIEITSVLELTDAEILRLADDLDPAWGHGPSVDKGEVYVHLRRSLAHELRKLGLGEKVLRVGVKVVCNGGVS